MTVEIVRPETLTEALALLAKPRVEKRCVNGGTDLMVQLKDGNLPAALWIDLSGLGALRSIKEQGRHFVLGSGVTHAQILRDPAMQRHAPALVQACAVIGGPQIRARGTIGGNVANASPAGDTVPPLMALGADVILKSARGQRTIALAEFFLGVRRTVMKPGELILAIRFPKVEQARGAFLRLGQRHSQAISKVSVAVSLTLGAKKVLQSVGIAMGSVAPTVLLAPRTMQAVEGQALTDATIAKARAAIREECKPITDLRSTEIYRREMCAELLERALRQACDM